MNTPNKNLIFNKSLIKSRIQ